MFLPCNHFDAFAHDTKHLNARTVEKNNPAVTFNTLPIPYVTCVCKKKISHFLLYDTFLFIKKTIFFFIFNFSYSFPNRNPISTTPLLFLYSFWLCGKLSPPQTAGFYISVLPNFCKVLFILY